MSSAPAVRPRARGPEALLALEDGSMFRGTGFGAEGEAFGEVVFNTAMVGYQEVLTDPSYAGQVVVMTSPHQGNYGTNPDDPESGRVRVAAFVVREATRRPSSWRAHGTLSDVLADAGTVAIEGVDTRRLTLRIREGGAMRCAVSTVDLEPASLVARVRQRPGMEGADLARDVSTGIAYEAASLVGAARPVDGRTYRVAAYDLGMKWNILRLLAAEGIEATVIPATTPAEDVLEGGYDGVFLSNGPGDPAATRYGIGTAERLLGAIPLFGICLGHQLIGRALGARTYKMKFGHRGANQPVLDLRTGSVEITSHNHGFAVDHEGWGVAPPPTTARRSSRDATPTAGEPAGPPSVATRHGDVELTHWNLNDGTLEGLRCKDIPAFAVQYHPEAAPGPHDARHLFGEFRSLMRGGG